MQVWLSKFTAAVFASAVTSAAALVAGILVLRILPADQAGRFTLITSAAGMLASIALFGQSNLINRVYASHATAYHWPRDLLNAVSLSAVLNGVGTAAVWLAFRLPSFELFFVAAFALLTIVVQIGAAMLNSYGHYVWASVLLRLGNALMLVPLALGAAGLLSLTVSRLLEFQLVITALCGLAALLTVRRVLPKPDGLPAISLIQRLETVGMAILLFAHLLLDPGLIVIAGARLQPAELAGFGAYFTLFGSFLLVWSILTQTSGVEFGRNPLFPRRKLLATVWAAMLPIVIVTWALLPWLVAVLYDGKYDAFRALAAPVAWMGGLLLIEAPARGFIAVLAPARVLWRYTITQGILGASMAAAALLLVTRFDVVGIAWAGTLMLVGRNAIAYGFYLSLVRPASVSLPSDVHRSQ